MKKDEAQKETIARVVREFAEGDIANGGHRSSVGDPEQVIALR